MKNITTKIMLFIAAVTFCISINSCKKTTTDSDLSTVQDEAQAESESNYLGNLADAGAAGNSNSAPRSTESQQIIPTCASVNYNFNGSGYDTITITFSNSCKCNDGKYRSGSVIIAWKGRYRDSGTVIHTYTKGYYVNGNAHNFTKWVRNAGLVNGYITFNINDTASIVTSTGTITWLSARQRQWIAGSSTPLFWWYTVYSVTGTASGTDRKGVSYTVAITQPIIADFSCIWILTKGTYDVMPNGKPERVIDFGNRSCDDNATCTINGVTFTFQFANY